MIVENWIRYKKIMCKCTKVEEGIKLIYKKTNNESIDILHFLKNENIQLFEGFLKKLVKLVEKNFVNKNDKSINNMKEKDKILDLIIEYIEEIGFFLDISSKKEFIWKIEEIDKFIQNIIKVFLIYEIHIVLCRDSVGYNQRGAITFNTNVVILNLPHLYGYEIEDIRINRNDDFRIELYDIFNDYVYHTIIEEDILLNIQIGNLLSNNFFVELTSNNIYDLILYMILQRCVSFEHKRYFYDIENKTYYCEECGEEFFLDNYKYDFYPKNMKYCEDCRNKLQKGYKNDYKEKVKIINELRQYKGKIPKEYNDLRNEYNKFMRSIDNRKKGDKLPNLNELGKMLLKLKNIKSKG